PEPPHVQPQVWGIVDRHVPAAGLDQPAGPANVPVTGMVDRHRRLNQSLVEPPVGPGRVVPEVFPHLVRLEVVCPVEVVDSGQVSRVVCRGRGHAGILNAGEPCSGHRIPTTPSRPGAGPFATGTGPDYRS